MHLYYTCTLNKAFEYVGKVGVHTPLKYHLLDGFILIEHTKKCTSGSLTGAVASQKVTEACEGKLNGSWKLSEEYNGISLPDCKTQQVEQRRKSVIVIQKYRVEGLLLNESKIR